MLLAGIVIGIIGGIYILTFKKINKWYKSIFTFGSLVNSGAGTFFVECPKCSRQVKRVKNGSQQCNSCHTYF